MDKRDHVLRAVDFMAQRGPLAEALAEHLRAKLRDDRETDPACVVRGVLKNLHGATAELRRELAAIES